MKNKFSHPRINNLSTQIKRVIGYRILLCFFLALSVVLTITIIEIASSSHQLEKNIEDQCKSLKSFVISQVLVKNEDAIQPKLDNLNQSSSNIKIVWDTTNNENAQKLHWRFPMSWIYHYPVKNIDGTKLGTFDITGSLLDDHGLFSDLLKKVSLLMLFFIIIFIVLYPLSSRIPQQLFIAPINNLLTLLRKEKNYLNGDSLSSIPQEIIEIKDKITELLQDAEKQSHEAALGQIAMQVAHDIRSPLMVLNLETEALYSISEMKRNAIRDAIQRVNDIANNLLSEYRQNRNTTQSETTFNSEPLVIMLESIISEKRVQVSNSSIKIELDKCPQAETFFVSVDIAGFKRALSNIINNSIEAIKDNGLILIKLSINAGKIVISITDNGCGIPKHQLPLVLEPGFTFGKTQGSGLGLPYIINKIYSWNGNYTINSEVNEGTTFELILPQARPPSWFASIINIPQDWTIVILDDDPLIHEIWNQKIPNETIKDNNLQIVHFHTPEELEIFCKSQNISNTIFLLDYELAGHEKNGLILAEELHITNKTTLVTSRYEDMNIRENCLRLGIKMMPKSFVMLSPIKIIKDVDLILIDDDELITDIWKITAASADKQIEVFNNIHDFMSIFQLYKNETHIYIDSSLGGDLKGEDFAKILFDNEYKNLFITTGHHKDNFKDIYWVKDVIDKHPPFLIVSS